MKDAIEVQKVLYIIAMCNIHALTVFSLKKKKKIVPDPRVGRETSAFPFLPPFPTTDPTLLFCVQGFEKGGGETYLAHESA